jgi:GDP-mannose 6-dehydrogenase
MRIGIFGMGYVGVVTGACFAKNGHDVLGVDIDTHKVRRLQQGKSPVLEEGIDELVGEMVAAGRLTATEDHARAVQENDVSLVSVGTPGLANGALDLRAVLGVVRQIGSALAHKTGPHTIVIRSTLLPGTTVRVILPELERVSGKRHGTDFFLCYNPEFLREGSSLKDFYDPPFTVVGAQGPEAVRVAAALYANVRAPLHHCAIETAEALKYVSNSFHGLKVAFANEIGAIMQTLGVDSHPLMALMCQDTKLNISPAYLRPGFAFGGSCLPKDLRALNYVAKERDVEAPLLGNLLRSNQAHLERAVRLVLETGQRDVALLGLSFKPGTDDLRESPLVILAEALIGKGIRLEIYDPHVNMSALTGANRRYIEQELPHIGSLLVDDLEKVLAHAKVVIVGCARHCEPETLARWARTGTLIDLDRVPDAVARAAATYRGISW